MKWGTTGTALLKDSQAEDCLSLFWQQAQT